ncbi:uncharacterized protein LOC135836015 [Planococcus citri]|uniref:uncharacterized protein LOC135836015 n=1 Tax=Planococcus citri TaxID=170843 RepID=UPI0031F942A2
MWLKSLNESTDLVFTQINASPVDTNSLQMAFEQLTVDLEEVENCRVTSTRSKDKPTYNFADAMPSIIRAKRVIPTVKRILMDAGRSTGDTKPPKSSNDYSRRIPEMEITPFSGDITLYSSFIKSFHLKYDELPIPKSEKLQHLKRHCLGEPLKIIETLDLTDSNYDLALNELDIQYHDKEEVIGALYAKLENLPKATNTNASLRSTYYDIEGLLTALESHGQNLDLFPPLKDKIYFKYPNWLVHQVCGKTKPTIKDFQREIGLHVKLRCGLQAAATAQGLSPSTKPHSTTAALVTSNATSKAYNNKNAEKTEKPKSPPYCVYCNQQHYSAECTVHTTVTARRSLLKNRCHICLNKNHTKAQCNRNTTCYYCKQVKSHHSSLCLRQFPEMPLEKPEQKDGSGKPEEKPDNGTPHTRMNSFIQTHQGAHCTAILTIINPKNNRRYQIRTLFDNGSNETYISEKAARRIGLELSKFKSIPINVFHHESPVTFSSATTSFIVTNNADFHLNIVADTAPNLPQFVQLFNIDEFKRMNTEYQDKQFVNQGEKYPVELLLGSDYFYDFLQPETKITVADGLHMCKTPFGFILVGRQHDQKRNNKSILFQMSPVRAVKELCDLESIGIKDMPLTSIQEEENALKQFYDNIQLVNNRYQIRFPWRQYPPPLEDNFGLAIGRLRSLQNKFTPESFNEYNANIQKHLDAGYVEEVTGIDMKTTQTYYLPHHAVFTPDKSTTQRIVFDGSAKSKNKQSINDAIYKGTNLLSHGCEILIRFRLYRIVILSDIEKAFHQLIIHALDRDFVRFLWLHDYKLPASGKNLRILRFLCVVFGIIASPFLLNATVRYHLKNNKNEFTEQMERDRYVDNFITGYKSAEIAKKYYHFAVEVFKRCSMNLRQWSTNDNQLRDVFTQPEKSASISVLGLVWNQYEDVFHLKQIKIPEVITLRTVLSTVAQFFDPCGYWTPISIKAKIFLRELHSTYNWDDKLSEDHCNECNLIFTELQTAAKQTMPRYQNVSHDSDKNHYCLHVFVDASAKACACVVYLSCKTEENITSHLLFSRTKLAKLTDIPKLELIAAYMGMKALQFVRDSLPFKIDTQVLWSDSKCVLTWILTSKILPVFIQRRIDEIRNIPNVIKNFIPGKENPADIPTRGMLVDELLNSCWFNGPTDWLKRSNDCTTLPFELTPELDVITIEEPRTVLTTNTDATPPLYVYPFDINPADFESYSHLLRYTSYFVKFIANNTRLPKNIFPNGGSLYSVRNLWLKFEQQRCYQDLLTCLRTKKPHPLITKYNAYLDEKTGLIRCSGRFKYAPLSMKEKCPILLPKMKDSRFVLLLFKFHHESAFHAGTNFVLNSLRRTYWLPDGRRSVYNAIQQCKKCKRFTTRPYVQPQISDLPEFRLQAFESPFTNVGIDTFGPLYVNKEKRYVLLATDLVIRGIDAELLLNMSTEEICLGLRRIIARHSTPKLILSDNAPQFKAVKQAFDIIFTHEWSWKFIPAHSPWMGGVYERMVALMKNSLLKTFHNVALSESLLRTALAEIAATLNDRPLTYVVKNDLDEIITPNHFLKSYFTVNDIPEQAEANATPAAAHTIKLFKQSNEITNRFWAVWRTAYLQHLRERGFSPNAKFPKATTKQPPSVGDVVIIVDALRKRNNWSLARIVELVYSQDNEVRSAKLRTKNGVIIRPISDLCPVELAAAQIPDSEPQPTSDDVDNDEVPPEENITPPEAAINEFDEPKDDWDDPIITVEEISDDNDD